jgi:hypothetical protein
MSDMPGTADSVSARQMQRLRADAALLGDPRRMGTLERLEQACSDLLSGAAMRLAEAHGRDGGRFRMSVRRLNPQAIEDYVRLRQQIEGRSYWSGPVSVTIRSDPDLKAYVKERAREAFGDRRPPKPNSSRRRIDEIVDRIPSLDDQSRLRVALEDGRQCKRELDLLREAVRKLPAVDPDILLKPGGAESDVTIHAPLSGAERELVKTLLGRIRNNSYLFEMGLVFRNGRLKMDGPPGKDLVLPEELRLLCSLAGLSSDEHSAG